ncbi:hypothetical protein PIIN_06024 [Serendipita indica DSM 11827]|uniref:Major facilitator superfamily (MFS) profile domain-containing protein n=1 Tax=Serendipita indica (strain DSM 11827) TaxID=1109443 RepID=G4TLA3_SERID|nr:hypothetical protein PIIN_06024 [Serendipita indica DSM 11827]
MSAEIAKSKTSLNAVDKDPDATAAATPAMSTTNDVREADTVKEKDPSALENVEGSTNPSNAINEADILTGKRLWLVWSAFLLSVLLVALDNTIVSTALPKLASYFNALDQLTWIVSAYLLTQAGFILIFGQILTIVPTKWIYLLMGEAESENEDHTLNDKYNLGFSADGMLIVYGSLVWELGSEGLRRYQSLTLPKSLEDYPHSLLTYANGWIHSAFPPGPIVPIPTHLRLLFTTGAFYDAQMWSASGNTMLVWTRTSEPLIFDFSEFVSH